MITFAIPNQTDDRYENKFPDGKRVYRVYAEGQTHHEHWRDSPDRRAFWAFRDDKAWASEPQRFRGTVLH